jgi:hypothetical protein
MLKENRTMRLFVLLIFFFVSSFLSGCSEKKDDKTLILEQIENLQSAIEKHNNGDFMDNVDAQYQDQLNNNRKSLQRMLLGFFLRYKDISVFTSAHQFDINSIRAEVNSQVVITGGKNLIPESARHYQVLSCWKKESDEWLLSCLKWQ